MSHTRLDVMLDAPWPDAAKCSRKEVIDEIPRRGAGQVHDVFTPCLKGLSSRNPRSKNSSAKNSFDRGAQLPVVVWLDA